MTAHNKGRRAFGSLAMATSFLLAGCNTQLSVGDIDKAGTFCGVPTGANHVGEPVSVVHGDSWSVVQDPALPEPSPGGTEGLSSVWGTGPSDVWVYGTLPYAVHFDGHAWTRVPTDTAGAPKGLVALWGNTPNDLSAIGMSDVTDPSTGNITPHVSVLHWDGASWSHASDMPVAKVNGVWSSGPNDVWATGYVFRSDSSAVIARRMHWDGASWSSEELPGFNPSYAFAGSAPDNVWMIGTNADHTWLQHWDGRRWSDVDVPQTQVAVLSAWTSGPNDVWFAGIAPGGRLDHYGCGRLTTVELLDPDYYGNTFLSVWGAAADDVWSAGLGGHVVHWDGTAWSAVAIPADAVDGYIMSVWGSGAHDVWAVGLHSQLLHLAPAAATPSS